MSTAEERDRFEGLGLGLGLAAGGALCWVLPGLLSASHSWAVAGQVAAGVLFTIGAAGALIELETKRRGFGELAITALGTGVGIGLLALGQRALTGLWAGGAAVLGVLVLVAALTAGGIGLGKLVSRPRAAGQNDSGRSVTARRSSSDQLTRGEKLTLGCAAIQIVLGALALL